MTSVNPARVAELTALLARAYPDALPWELARIMVAAVRAARRAKRLSERICNGELGEAAAERARRRQDATARRLNRALAIAVGRGPGPAPDQTPTIYLGGDPRGPCGWMQVPGLPGDPFSDWYALYC